MRKKTRVGGPRKGSGRKPMRPRPVKPKGGEDTRRNRLVVMVYDQQLEKVQRLAREQDLPISTVVFESLARGLAEIPMPRKRKK